MNYMRQISEMLGLEWDDEKQESEKFMVSSLAYKLVSDGLITTGSGAYANGTLTLLLSGTYTLKKLPWKPKDGDLYYMADIRNQMMYSLDSWDNADIDKIRLERGLVFRLPVEAVEKAKEILKLMGVDE